MLDFTLYEHLPQSFVNNRPSHSNCFNEKKDMATLTTLLKQILEAQNSNSTIDSTPNNLTTSV
jgi:hypothetical protein